jgi:hypothetical protein
MQSEVIRLSSEVIRGHQMQSVAIKRTMRVHRWMSSEVIRGHQRSSEVISSHQADHASPPLEVSRVVAVTPWEVDEIGIGAVRWGAADGSVGR